MRTLIVILFSFLSHSIAMATIQFSPIWLNMGRVSTVGPIFPRQTVVVHNDGPESHEFRMDAIQCWGEFLVEEGSCHQNLQPGRQCFFYVTFHPRTTGIKSCKIELRDWYDSNFYETYEVSGTGI